MSYLEFLGQWYNLPWVAAILAGVAMGPLRRIAARPGGEGPALRGRVSLRVALVAAGVLGLTLNGAVHDFGSADAVPRWFPAVALAAGLGAWLIARGVRLLRGRYFPPVRGVTFNRGDLDGAEAVVLNASLEPEAVGRARHHDAEGVSHIVRIHLADPTPDVSVGFGRRVRLGAFDAERRSYPVEPVR